MSRTTRGWLTASNALSAARVPLAIAFLLTFNRTARVLLLCAAAASDFFDGWLARHYGQGSRLGELLDPITDKIFLVAALISFQVHGQVSFGGLMVLLARDIAVIVGLAVVLLRHTHLRLKSRFPGKVVTTFQLATVLLLTLWPRTGWVAVAAVGAASAWAIFDYGRVAVRSLRFHSATR